MTMLDRMRRHRGWLKWLLGIVAVSMAAFFVPWHNRQPQLNDAVARVDGTPITTGEFRRLLNARLQAFQQQGGGSLPPETLRQLGFDRQILNQLVDQRAVEAEAHRRGITVTDTEVREAIRHMPGFQENGQFVGYDRYRAVLRAQRPPYREEDFENLVRSELLAEKLQDAVTGWITVSESEVDAEYRKRNEKVKLDVVSFQADQFRAGITATDADALALFTKDPSRWKFGERRKVRYLLVDTQALRAGITPTAAQIEAFYNENLQQQFSNPEQVHALHILLKTQGQDTAAVRKRAEGVLKEARGGADFATLARKYSEDVGSKGSGGDLNFFGRGSMVKPFEDAAFAMEPGQISDLVQTDYGFHIIKVLERRAAGQRPLAEVHDQIAEQLKWQLAQSRAQELSTTLAARIKSPADLDAAAKENGLTVKETGFFQRADVIPEFGPTSQVASEAFDLKEGAVSGAVRTGQAFVFLTVTGREDARVPKFEEVKEKVRADVVTDKALAAARAKAAEVAAAAKGGTPLAAAAKAAGKEVRTTELIARSSVIADVGVSAAVDAVAFSRPVGTTSDVIPTDNGAAVVKVVERTAVNDGELSAARDSLRRELLAQRRGRFFAAYMNKAKDTLTITTYPEALARASGL
jgi:peptidyl-prolyl cis-trans isomerase D